MHAINSIELGVISQPNASEDLCADAWMLEAVMHRCSDSCPWPRRGLGIALFGVMRSCIAGLAVDDDIESCRCNDNAVWMIEGSFGLGVLAILTGKQH